VTREERESPGYTLLGRGGSAGVTELLAVATEAGEALCLFESRERAIAFARLERGLRNQGWTLHEICGEALLDLLAELDHVVLDPDPRPGAGKELVSATGLARSIRLRGA